MCSFVRSYGTNIQCHNENEYEDNDDDDDDDDDEVKKNDAEKNALLEDFCLGLNITINLKTFA